MAKATLSAACHLLSSMRKGLRHQVVDSEGLLKEVRRQHMELHHLKVDIMVDLLQLKEDIMVDPLKEAATHLKEAATSSSSSLAAILHKVDRCSQEGKCSKEGKCSQV